MSNGQDRHSPLWWESGVVYQIYPRSFQDSNGDGVGDLAGIAMRLDYLTDTLPIDAIWLSPFYPSPMADFGYDVSNYVDVDPLFGTLEDFDRLVDAAHRRGLKIIIDFVPNHTSDQHPWFLASRASRDNPKRDWYIWVDPEPDGSPPNNWLSVFGGSAWEWDEATGQYYLHSFLKEQPDLNWRNPEVQNAMFDVLRFWLERGVDGFRVDAAHFIMKDPELRDNPPNPEATPELVRARPYEQQSHVHDKAHPDIHAVYRDMRRVLDAYSAERPRMSLGEIHIFDPAEWASYYGDNLDEFHMPFNFAPLFAPWTAADIGELVDATEGAVPPGGWPNYVFGNHDVPRVASRIGPAQARIAMLLLLTLRGTPTIYYGDEIGMHDVPIPAERTQDPFERLTPGQGRDPERTPMQWDSSPNAGFCPPDVQPWLPISPDHVEVNVARETAEPQSMLALTQRLLALRRAAPVLQTGSYRRVAAPADCLAYVREDGDQRLLIAVNFSGEEKSLTLGPDTVPTLDSVGTAAPSLSAPSAHPSEPVAGDTEAGRHGGPAPTVGTETSGDNLWLVCRVLLSSYLDREETLPSDTLALRPNEGCIIEV